MNGENFNMTTQGQQASAPTSAAPAANSAPPSQAPSQAPANDEFSELRRLASADAERMGRTIVDNTQGVEGGSGQSEPEMTLPAGLVNNQFANQQPANPAVQQQVAQPAQAPQQQQPQATSQPNQQTHPPTDGQQPATEKSDAAEQQAREISKIVLKNASGQPMEFENDQLLGILQGYQYYQNNLQAIQNDFNQKYQQVETVRQQVLVDQARIDSLMKSEKGFILEALESNPEFSNKVAELISQHPELLTGYQNRKVDAVSQQGGQKIQEVEQKLNQLLQQQQESQQQAQQARQQAFVDQTVNTVRSNVAQLNQQYQVPQKTIDALTAQAVLEVQSNRLPFNPQAITGWFEFQMKAIAADLANIKNQVKSEYLTQKQSAPPPPPTGGGAPSPVNMAEMTPRDRVRMIAGQLAQMNNGSLR